MRRPGPDQTRPDQISPRRPLRRHLLPKVANDTRAPPFVVLPSHSTALARCPSRVNDGIYPCSALASHKDTWLAVDGLAFLHGGPTYLLTLESLLHPSSIHLFNTLPWLTLPIPIRIHLITATALFSRPPSSVDLVLAPHSAVCLSSCPPRLSTSLLPLGSTAYPEHLTIPVSWPCPFATCNLDAALLCCVLSRQHCLHLVPLDPDIRQTCSSLQD